MISFTFEFVVPPQHEEAAEDFMECLAMDGVTDPEEIERRFEAWLEDRMWENTGRECDE